MIRGSASLMGSPLEPNGSRSWAWCPYLAIVSIRSTLLQPVRRHEVSGRPPTSSIPQRVVDKIRRSTDFMPLLSNRRYPCRPTAIVSHYLKSRLQITRTMTPLHPIPSAATPLIHRNAALTSARKLHLPSPKSTIDTNHYAHSTFACRPYNRKSKSAIS